MLDIYILFFILLKHFESVKCVVNVFYGRKISSAYKYRMNSRISGDIDILFGIENKVSGCGAKRKKWPIRWRDIAHVFHNDFAKMLMRIYTSLEWLAYENNQVS